MQILHSPHCLVRGNFHGSSFKLPKHCMYCKNKTKPKSTPKLNVIFSVIVSVEEKQSNFNITGRENLMFFVERVNIINYINSK